VIVVDNWSQEYQSLKCILCSWENEKLLVKKIGQEEREGDLTVTEKWEGG
jgi:hypothetical protein